ncbi:MAG: hypothetical protein PHF86_13705 [Candidatus Nanoarchaeia archaeon]|nr:hypothetical protein [Candidatus Nanoarchaeia archaeon]
MKNNIIGIVPNKNEKKIKEGIKLNRNLVHNCEFALIDYHNLLLKTSLENELYDLIIFYNIVENTNNNICVASYEIRNKFDTLFLIPFNPAGEIMHNRDVILEKLYLKTLLESNINGIVLTDSTDESFLMNIVRDMIAGKEEYSKIKHKIKDQRDFLVYKPDFTEQGYKDQI